MSVSVDGEERVKNDDKWLMQAHGVECTKYLLGLVAYPNPPPLEKNRLISETLNSLSCRPNCCGIDA